MSQIPEDEKFTPFEIGMLTGLLCKYYEDKKIRVGEDKSLDMLEAKLTRIADRYYHDEKSKN